MVPGSRMGGPEDHGVDEAVENQRFWGVMWGPPLIPGYDWPAWSDAQGQPIQLARPPSIDGESGWFVVRMPSTDEEGWLYGTSFERLAHARPGGRASKRANDQVRSRVWRKLKGDMELQSLVEERTRAGPIAPSSGGSGPSLAARVPAISSSQILSALTSNIIFKQLPKPSVFRMWQALMELWNDSARRHGVLKVVPLDPVGLYLAMKQHAKGASELRARGLASGRLLLLAPCAEESNNVEQSGGSASVSGSGASASAASGLGLLQQAAKGLFPGAAGGGSSGSASGPALARAGSGPQGVSETLVMVPQPVRPDIDGVPVHVAGSGRMRPGAAAGHASSSGGGSAVSSGAQETAAQERQGPVTGEAAVNGTAAQGSTLLITAKARGTGATAAAPTPAQAAGSGTAGGVQGAGVPSVPSHPLHQPVHHHHSSPSRGSSGAASGLFPVRTAPAPPQPPPSPFPAALQRLGQALSNAVTGGLGGSSSNAAAESTTQGFTDLRPSPGDGPKGRSSADGGFDAAAGLRGSEADAHHPLAPAGPEAEAHASTAPGAPGTGTGLEGGAAAAAEGASEQQPRAPSLPDISNMPALLQELMTITNYTRAAYGYVMAAGHMASLGSMMQMVGYSAFFNPITGASVEANNQAIHALTGIPQSDILMAEWRNHVFRPCHYLAVDRAHARLVLSIRGSLELGDICTDLAAQPAQFTLGPPLGDCHVHQGLLAAALYVEQSTKEALEAGAQAFPGWPILITGHSLGAGVAALLTLMLRHGHGEEPRQSPLAERIYCVGVACPPAASLHVATACDDYVVTLVHNMDFVPRLSHYSVEIALMDMVRSSPAAQLADSLNTTLSAMMQTTAPSSTGASGQAGPGSNTTRAGGADDNGGNSSSILSSGVAGAVMSLLPGAASAAAAAAAGEAGPSSRPGSGSGSGGRAARSASAAAREIELGQITQRSAFSAVVQSRGGQTEQQMPGSHPTSGNPSGGASPAPEPEGWGGAGSAAAAAVGAAEGAAAAHRQQGLGAAGPRTSQGGSPEVVGPSGGQQQQGQQPPGTPLLAWTNSIRSSLVTSLFGGEKKGDEKGSTGESSRNAEGPGPRPGQSSADGSSGSYGQARWQAGAGPGSATAAAGAPLGSGRLAGLRMTPSNSQGAGLGGLGASGGSTPAGQGATGQGQEEGPSPLSGPGLLDCWAGVVQAVADVDAALHAGASSGSGSSSRAGAPRAAADKWGTHGAAAGGPGGALHPPSHCSTPGVTPVAGQPPAHQGVWRPRHMPASSFGDPLGLGLLGAEEFGVGEEDPGSGPDASASTLTAVAAAGRELSAAGGASPAASGRIQPPGQTTGGLTPGVSSGPTAGPAGHSPSAQGNPSATQPVAGAPRPPGAEEVVGSVMSDLSAIAAAKEAQGGPGAGSVMRITNEELSAALQPTKLYLPGRVLWVMYEEEGAVQAAMSGRQGQGPASGEQVTAMPPASISSSSRGASMSGLPQGQQQQQQQQVDSRGGTGGSGGGARHARSSGGGGGSTATASSKASAGAGSVAAGDQSSGGPHVRSHPLARTPRGSSDGEGQGQGQWVKVPGRAKQQPPPQAPQQQQQWVDVAQDFEAIQESCHLLEAVIAQDFVAGSGLGHGYGGREGGGPAQQPVRGVGATDGQGSRQQGQGQQQGSQQASQQLQQGEAVGEELVVAADELAAAQSQQEQLLARQGSAEEGEGGGSGKQASLSQALTEGLKKLKSSVESVLGKAAAQELLRSGSSSSSLFPRASGSGTGAGGAGAASTRRVCLLEADRTLFETLALVPSCAADHIPDSYLTALLQLAAAAAATQVQAPPAEGSPGVTGKWQGGQAAPSPTGIVAPPPGNKGGAAAVAASAAAGTTAAASIAAAGVVAGANSMGQQVAGQQGANSEGEQGSGASEPGPVAAAAAAQSAPAAPTAGFMRLLRIMR